MIIKAEELGKLLVIRDIICDCCGNSCYKADLNYEYATFHARWGYCSANDLDEWESHLCEACSLKVRAFIESLGGKVRITHATR